MNVKAEIEKYMEACYGNGPVLPQQRREVVQALLSGMALILTEPEPPSFEEIKLLLIENRSLADPRRN